MLTMVGLGSWPVGSLTSCGMADKACLSPSFLECRMGSGIRPHLRLRPKLSEPGGLKHPPHGSRCECPGQVPTQGVASAVEPPGHCCPEGVRAPGQTVQYGGEVTWCRGFRSVLNSEHTPPTCSGLEHGLAPRGWGSDVLTFLLPCREALL